MLGSHRETDDIAQLPLRWCFERGEARLTAEGAGVHRERCARARAVAQAGCVYAEWIVNPQTNLACGAADGLKLRATEAFGLDAEAGGARGLLREDVGGRARIE